MPKIRRSLVLPVLFSAIEGILWYWDLHSRGWVPSYTGVGSKPAFLISSGLDFPARLWTLLSAQFLDKILAQYFYVLFNSQALARFSEWLLGTPTQIYFLLSVAGCWYLIGRWLDRGGAAKNHPEVMARRARRVTWKLFIFASGLFSLFFSLHLQKHVLSFYDTLLIAMIQTWAVFLMVMPAQDPTRKLIGLARRKPTGGLEICPTRAKSNSNFFIVVLAVFAGTLILGTVAYYIRR